MSESVFKAATAILGVVGMITIPIMAFQCNRIADLEDQLHTTQIAQFETRDQESRLNTDLEDFKQKYNELERLHREGSDQLRQTQAALASAVTANSDLQAQLESMEDQRLKAEKDLKKANASLVALEAKAKTLSKTLAMREGELAQAARELAQAQTDLQISEASNTELRWDLVKSEVQTAECAPRYRESCVTAVYNALAVAKNVGIDAIKRGCNPRYVTTLPIADEQPIRLPSGWVELCADDRRLSESNMR